MISTGSLECTRGIAAEMTVKEITAEEQPQFDALAEEHGALFTTARWIAIFGSNLKRLGIYEAGGELFGGFCIYQQRKCGFCIMTNAPFTRNCGPFLQVKAQHPVAVLELWRDALEALARYLRWKRPAFVYLRFDERLRDLLPLYWAKFRVIPSYTYILDLSASIESLLAGMASVRRRNVQRAIKDGLHVRPASDSRTLQKLAEGTFKRQGKQVDHAALEAILFRFATAANSYGFVAYNEERPVACTFVVHDRRTAYYILGGYADDQKHHGAGALAMWESIKHAKELGLESFDFEGSMLPAIERYFRGFGGTLTPYFTANRAWLPIEFALKLTQRSLF